MSILFMLVVINKLFCLASKFVRHGLKQRCRTLLKKDTPPSTPRYYCSVITHRTLCNVIKCQVANT